jgi:diphthine-ammonia ligase
LTYLWQRSRKELLEEMIGRGVEAILVKVAGAGLVPEKHLGVKPLSLFISTLLGKTLATLSPTIARLHERFQLDHCGEGGEYESFVIDCPLFPTQRIEIVRSEIIYDAEDPSVGNLKILECQLIEKSETVGTSVTESPPSAVETSDKPAAYSLGTADLFVGRKLLPYSSVSPNPQHRQLSFDQDGYCQSPLIYPSASCEYSTQQEMEEACVAQLTDIFTQLIQLIESVQSPPLISLSDAVYAHLYLSDMSLFETMNSCYCSYFATTRYPPSRVCVTVSF